LSHNNMPNIRPLNKELQAKAEAELFEKPDRIEADLAALKAWLAKTPHLKARTDDQLLLNFLRGCKFSLEKTKEKLDNFYTFRGAIPELFADRKITQETIDFIKMGVVVPLPKTDGPDGPRIMLIRSGCYDADKVDIWRMFKATSLIQDIMLLEDDNMVVAGTVNIMDVKGATMSHFTKWTPSMMKKMTMVWQDANPIRIKGLHYVNTPSFFLGIFNVFKVFLNEKIQSRINIVGDQIEPLYEKISRELLPAEYGGNAGTIEEILDYWVKKVKEYEQYFLDDAKYGTDEKKRPGKPKNAENLFGLEGSFRQLEIF